MVKNDMTFKIGGEAGQGAESSGSGFTRAIARSGLYAFATQGFMSRIRGGYNFFQLRISEVPIYGHRRSVHLMLALNEQAAYEHLDEIVPGGAIIYDSSEAVDEARLRQRGIQPFAYPLTKTAQEIGRSFGMDAKRAKLMANTGGLGIVAGVTGFPLQRIAAVIEENFGKRKGAAVAQANLKVAQTTYEHAQAHWASRYQWKLEPSPNPKPLMIINGNQAICLGAIAAGCRFISAYPMTPSSTIIEFMSAKARQFDIVTKQTEDEIAAMQMAIGAAHAGVRAMTATSGGGFSLMAESLGMAAMTETPLVVVDAQRPGPSTGMPTRTDQGDLLFVMHASQGEFPRIVLAPGSIEECFEAGWRAFNLAEKYQCPVIILTDTYQVFSQRTVEAEAIDFGSVAIDRGELLTEAELDRIDGDGYRRYRITETGISPRALPGHPKAVFSTTSDEHTEEGYIEDEDAANRVQQMEKRMRKITHASSEMRPPSWYGPADADVTLLSWGSTKGVVREAVDLMSAEGLSVNNLHFYDIYPLPEDALAAEVGKARYLVSVEANYTGQMAKYIRMCTGRKADLLITKYDGRPFSADEIVARAKSEVLVYA